MILLSEWSNGFLTCVSLGSPIRWPSNWNRLRANTHSSYMSPRSTVSFRVDVSEPYSILGSMCCALKPVFNIDGIPGVKWFGSEGDYNVLVIDLLGWLCRQVYSWTCSLRLSFTCQVHPSKICLIIVASTSRWRLCFCWQIRCCPGVCPHMS